MQSPLDRAYGVELTEGRTMTYCHKAKEAYEELLRAQDNWDAALKRWVAGYEAGRKGK